MTVLTPQERKVIIFLAAVFLLGAGISVLRKRWQPLDGVMRLDTRIARMDINRARKEDLVAVKVVPEKLAAQIIAFRDERGTLREMEELRELKGIGEKRLKKLETYFYAQ